MLQLIQQFFEQQLSEPTQSNHEDTIQLATAALFIEMMQQDGQITEEERESVRNALFTSFKLSTDEVNELFFLAEEEIKQSTDYYQFTQLINQQYSQTEKIQIIENLWRIAYSDNHLDDLEEHMVRRIADLIYVPHMQFIKAKHKVENSLNQDS